MCELENQAIMELFDLAGLKISLNTNQSLEDARNAIQDLKEAGYSLYRLYSPEPFKSIFILQQDSKEIARRGVVLNIVVS